jgi:hypothetical protein
LEAVGKFVPGKISRPETSVTFTVTHVMAVATSSFILRENVKVRLKLRAKTGRGEGWVWIKPRPQPFQDINNIKHHFSYVRWRQKIV